MARERIQKVLSEAGVASRRAVEEMILEGRITINGELVATLPCFIGPGDEVLVDNMPVRKRPSNKRYYLLNKPKHVVCTQDDPQGRRRAADLLPPMKERLFCVGRLDADSTGIIIMTNDGELTQRLTHPSYEVPKTYQVEIAGELSPSDIEKFKRGIWMDGKRTMPAQLRVVRKTRDRSVIQVTLREGRNREIRRMLARLKHKVYKLGRVAIGPITDRGLKLGSCRELTEEEVEQLHASCQAPKVHKKSAPGSRKHRKLVDQKKRRQGLQEPRPTGPASSRKKPEDAAPMDRAKRLDDDFLMDDDDLLDEPMPGFDLFEEPSPKPKGQTAGKRRPQRNAASRSGGRKPQGGPRGGRSGGRRPNAGHPGQGRSSGRQNNRRRRSR